MCTAGDLMIWRRQKSHRPLLRVQPCPWTAVHNSAPRDAAVSTPWVHFHLTALIDQLLWIKIHTHALTALSVMAPLLWQVWGDLLLSADSNGEVTCSTRDLIALSGKGNVSPPQLWCVHINSKAMCLHERNKEKKSRSLRCLLPPVSRQLLLCFLASLTFSCQQFK